MEGWQAQGVLWCSSVGSWSWILSCSCWINTIELSLSCCFLLAVVVLVNKVIHEIGLKINSRIKDKTMIWPKPVPFCRMNDSAQSMG